MYPLKRNTAINIPFFAFDSNGNPVTGKVTGDWTKRISKGGGAFAALTATITEMEGGWYSLALTGAHTDTLGLLTVYLTCTGVLQVNLQVRVFTEIPDDAVIFLAGANEFTYTVTDNSAVPIEAVDVWISTDSNGTNVVWRGRTNSFGVALDINGNKPKLDTGVYYFFRKKNLYSFTDPDMENVG
jgi:hypothetical protein